MFKFPHTLVLSLLGFFTFSCNPVLEQEQLSLQEGVPNFYLSGMAVDENSSNPFSFEIGVALTPDELERHYQVVNLLSSESGVRLECGVYLDHVAEGTTQRAQVDFWPDNVGGDGIWNAEEIRSFFAVGKQFELGSNTADNFSFGVFLPADSTSADALLSRDRFLANPTGTFRIIAAQDYEFISNPFCCEPNSTPLCNTVSGMRIIAEIQAEVGRYNAAADVLDGQLNTLETDETVTIEAGEIAFFIPFDEDNH